MARDHARIWVSIWDDPDWCNLIPLAQHAYFLLVSHPELRLSYCGVGDWVPVRLLNAAQGLTRKRLLYAVAELRAARFVLVDEESREVLVRSYVRHDGVMERINMGKAVARAVGRVHSPELRRAVVDELARLRGERPALLGWRGLQEVDPTLYGEVVATALGTPVPPPAQPSLPLDDPQPGDVLDDRTPDYLADAWPTA